MPYCLECEKLFEDTLDICPACGGLLEDEAEACADCGEDCESCALGCSHEACDGNCDAGIWPLGDDGEPVKPVRLTTVMGNQLDYEMTISLLNSFGIPTVRDYPNAGQLVKILVGFTGAGMDVYVPENMAQLAKELMDAEPYIE